MDFFTFYYFHFFHSKNVQRDRLVGDNPVFKATEESEISEKHEEKWKFSNEIEWKRLDPSGNFYFNFSLFTFFTYFTLFCGLEDRIVAHQAISLHVVRVKKVKKVKSEKDQNSLEKVITPVKNQKY